MYEIIQQANTVQQNHDQRLKTLNEQVAKVTLDLSAKNTLSQDLARRVRFIETEKTNEKEAFERIKLAYAETKKELDTKEKEIRESSIVDQSRRF